MNNLKLTVFDVFTYILPGLCFVYVIFLLMADFEVQAIYAKIQDIRAFEVTLLLILSYLIGFIIDIVSSITVNKVLSLVKGDIKERVIKDFNEYSDARNGSEFEVYQFSLIYSYVDLYSPQARLKADQLSAMSGLARNVGMSLFISAILIIVYYLYFDGKCWHITVSFASIMLSVLLFFRSDTFRKWSHLHLLNSYYFLSKEKT